MLDSTIYVQTVSNFSAANPVKCTFLYTVPAEEFPAYMMLLLLNMLYKIIN